MSGELLNALLAFQPDAPELRERREYDKQARGYVEDVQKIGPSHFLKGADTPQDVLNVLNPTANSIAYATTLRIRIHQTMEKNNTALLAPGNATWNRLVLFLESFDPVQMRYAGTAYRKLVENVEQMARAAGSVGGGLCMCSLYKANHGEACARHITSSLSHDAPRPHYRLLHVHPP
jgi:COP9 signalosome complex subunit 3